MLTEKLTDEMTRALRAEADAADDIETAAACDRALRGVGGWEIVCEAINDARGMDDSTPYVAVTP